MRPFTRVVAVSLVGALACIDSTDPSSSGGLQLQISASVGAIDSGRVVVTGPTTATVKFVPGEKKAIGGLAPGTYTVALEGYVPAAAGGGVGYFKQITGVSVVKGQTTAVTVPDFPPFRPSIRDVPAYTVDGRVSIVYSSVPGAASYIVQRDTFVDFRTARDTTIAAADTNPTVSIVLSKPSNVRVLAVTPSGARGQPSVASVVAAVTQVLVTPTTATIASGATQTFTAVAKDAGGNTVTGVTFFWVSSNQNVALVDQTGVATGMAGGAATISALGLGLPGNATLTVSAPVPTQLAFTVQPASATAGAAISPAVQVEVRDATGARVATARIPVTIAIGANPSGGVLSGTLTVNAINGIATFPGLSIDYAGTGYTLVASSAGLTSATSAAFNITPGPQPHGVALLAKTAYVDFDGTSTGSEASNLMFTLQSFGLTVDPFVDISDLNIIAVTRNTRILAIPELENGDVTPDLSTTARQRIASYVRNGGTLMAFTTNTSTVRATSVVNTLFGFTVAATSGVGPYTLDATGAAGTAFEGGPASIPELDATIPVTEASLPPGSKVIYRSGANAAVAVIPVGSGRIIIIGWDWFNAPPKGTAVEGGWVDVLRRGTL